MTKHRAFSIFWIALLGSASGCSKTSPPVAAPSGTPEQWSWAGADGPTHWGELSPKFALCGSGKHQTPLALSTADAAADAALAPLAFAFPAATLRLGHNSHNFEAVPATEWQTTAPGGSYRLVAFHFHSPSEHTIDGKQLAAEMHLVHKNAKGELAVVALLFDVGAANVPLQAVLAAAPTAPGADASTAAPVDLGALLPQREPYFTYSGSLTVPPCTEGITWFVFETPRSLDQAQLDRLHATMHGPTNRPLQPRGDRAIAHYVP